MGFHSCLEGKFFNKTLTGVSFGFYQMWGVGELPPIFYHIAAAMRLKKAA